MSRIGILGGTFNPPHVGHLLCAQEAHHAVALDRVVLVPTGTPPHKPLPDDPGAQHRLEMCWLACGGEEWLSASAIEVERDGPSYTIDTLRAIHAQAPGDELTFIVGGDMAATMPRWREPEAILDLAVLAVAEREGAKRQDLERTLGELGRPQRVVFIDMPRVDVSSTMVRRRVAEGRPVRWLVPREVARYVAANGLYAARAAVAGRPSA